MHIYYSPKRFPLYFAPVLILVYPCFLTMIMAVFFTVLLYLTTCWSQSMRIHLTLRRNKQGRYILYQNILCKIESKGVKYFVYKRCHYIIGEEIFKVENLLDIQVNEFKKVNETKNILKEREDKIRVELEKEDPNGTLRSRKNNENANELKTKINKSIETLIEEAVCIASKSKDKIERIYAMNKLYAYLNIPNDFDYKPPSFLLLFFQHATAPLFVFQIFCSLLWCLDEYPYHALFTMVMQILFEAGIVFTRLRNLKEFGTLRLRATKIHDLKEGIKSSHDLRPGDIIRMTKAGETVPCDMLILKGSAAVCEAMLTGESTIVKKEEILEEDSKIFADDVHKRNILYGGTEIVKIGSNANEVTGVKKEEQFVDCYVLRTGFDTQQGALIKTMMEGEDSGINNKEAFMFIFCLLFFAVIASFYVIKCGIENGKNAYKILLEVIIILTNVVPPELPMEMTLAVNSALQSLLQYNIFCLESFRIPTAGKVDICCFDKTGTLTEVALSVVKVLQPNLKNSQNEYTELTSDTLAQYNHDDVKLAIACCHSLIVLRGFRGDPLEESIFKFLNLKLKNEEETSDGVFNYKSLKKYPFTSELRRMTVVTERIKTSSEVFVCMKGAPEVVLEYLENVPEFYWKFEEMSMMGYRVIALATKKYKYKVKYNREDVEKNLSFVGFILYDCKIKSNTVEAIDILRESNHKLVMITGDNLLTALSVAKKVGIVDEEIEHLKNTSSTGKIVHYVGKVGVEGDEIEKILQSDDFFKYSVFARANPMQKERIISKYKNMGKVTLMCGDGTNDVGALKVADVGVALVDGKVNAKPKTQRGMTEDDHVKLGDASVAAPFTAKTGSIMAVVDIIKQGRSTLVTTIQMYKILGLNSLISAYSLSILDCMGIRYGDVQMTVSGILIAFAFMFLTRSKTLKDISKQKPVDNIFNRYILTSVILQTIIHVLAFTILLKSGIVEASFEYDTIGFGMKSPMMNDTYVESQIHRVSEIKPEDKHKFRPSLMNSAVFLLSISQQVNTFIINYIGRPFRESLIENTKLNFSLLAVTAILLGLVMELHEGFSRMMEISPLNGFKWQLLLIIGVDFGLCFLIEKISFYMFML